MTCRASMILTAVVSLTDTKFPELCRLPDWCCVPRPLRSLITEVSSRSLVTVDVESGRRYPVFIVLVRYCF